MTSKLPTDLKTVLESEIKEWHFHIYFHQNNAEEQHAALELRDAVLRLRRDGAFIAVPSFKVNTDPVGPHPVGSYEIWVPAETFSSVFSYLSQNRGTLSILVHPLTRDTRMDYEQRAAWLGPAYPLDLSKLPARTEVLPAEYTSLKVGYSCKVPFMNLGDRAALGSNVEKVLLREQNAARAPLP
ncbi:DOPA-like domain-containing protein [Roridomyces roridus]|uniref:DOPA-like domain-containing protein n=1 Tax=Roridomyces roridus TaxID=1738132 RepID=A0AAD7FVV8_9AGAR|nr:DOPA-like domain-containing protein [Roridomyces roridus]